MQKRSDISTVLRELKPGATAVVFASFVLLQVFKLISLLITNKTAENILIIPFQLVIFLLPSALFLIYRRDVEKKPPLKGLRLRAPRVYQIPILASATLLLICGNVLISLVFAGTGSLEDGFTLYNTFVSRNGGGFFETFYLVLAYAAVPAFCEEFVFRALLCRELERFNVLSGIVASAVFFAMLHFDLSLFPVYFFSGILLALTMYATGSVIASMTVHMAFNLTGLFGQPVLNAFYNITGGTDGLFVFILGMLTILSAALFCTFASKCYSIRARHSNMPDMKILPKASQLTRIASDIFITPFSIASFILYIAVLVISVFL